MVLKIYFDSVQNEIRFSNSISKFLPKNFSVVQIPNGSTYYTCGHDHRWPGRDWKPFNHTEEFRLSKGFDDEMDEDEDIQESPEEAAEKTPVPLPQKLQVKDKINQVKNLNSEGHDEAPPPPEGPPPS